ncbi:DUF4190 domain-containing protein [Rathayibacter sp. VKM Ac-2926]|uniref:DUF4190 domain-containing protein n=1 Tax=Rathayibacter sp. VKM Ac-2926 TaxID=2929477 RepID=UPI001FB45010|nr:DUF4190 domain-containing protein [Rathayibacter sp. VKM Ac-2926]MCJ1705010.1 DUF4190 domain-containing protein [Rathayibacter sp. VKM Ac-2926]
MPDDSAPLPAPGWYPHPADLGAELYWDGAAWTDRSRPAVPPAPAYGTPEPEQPATPGYGAAPEYGAAPGYGAAPQYPVTPGSGPAPGYGPAAGYGAAPARRNSLAIASLVLGIASILINPLLVPSILAIVFGVRGRAASAQLGGRGFATAGLITGVIGIVFGVLSFLARAAGLSS